MLVALIVLHLVLGSCLLASGRRLGRRALAVGALAPFATAVWAATQADAVLDGVAVTSRTAWVPRLGLSIDLRLDAFSLLMVVLVSGIGSLVFLYAWHYFSDGPRTGRAAGLLTVFSGSMLGLVVADNLLLLFLFWELTSITSYLLIGLDDADPGARSAALHALLVTGLGGLAMLGGIVVLGHEAGTLTLTELVSAPPTGAATTVALVLILIGVFTKSAQYPFHSWLPGAMVAPTPISAYLHSAAMVKAGVYLLARLAPPFADQGPWRPLVVSVGLVTMIAGGIRALRPFDLKQLLAFGTISQLGFLVVLFGLGRPEATAAGCVLLLAHALFKAALFMVVGVVDHEAGTRDVRRLPLLGRGWTVARLVAVVSAASMAAVPPLVGFVAKEKAYESLLDGSGADRLVLAGVVVGSMLTVAYSARLVAALVRPDLIVAVADRPVLDHGPSRSFVAPAVALGLTTAVLGVLPFTWTRLADGAARALDPASSAELSLWHGFNVALGLSVLTLGVGGALFAARRPIAAAQARLAPPVDGVRVYETAVRGVLGFAGRVTGVVQSGSLPVYVGIILTTAAVAPLVALSTGDWWPGWPEAIGRPAHVPLAALIVTAGLAATIATRRFAAALLLGVVGYGMALLFVVQGAPDLALTQFAVETLSVVVFLLVLRVLPDRFERPRQPMVGRVARVGVSLAVGVAVVVVAIAASGARTAEPVSTSMSERALPDGFGKNVVNVILVDIRGLDTIGEVTVLVVAAIGITALARAGARPRRRADGASAAATPPNVPMSAPSGVHSRERLGSVERVAGEGES